jgi:hypothetical protein
MSEIKTAMKIVALDIEKLVPYERNVKKHPKEQVDKIVASIKAAGGWDQPIVVDKNYVIIKGHGRRLAALQLGLKKVPVLVRDDMTEEQVKAARMADNRAAVSDIDTEMFRLELSTMSDDLLRGIFDDKELDFSLADLGAMNTDVFIDDLDAAVSAQKTDTDLKMAETKDQRVPLKKAFGFDSITAKDEIYVNRFMAKVEEQSGLKGEEALMQFVKALVVDGSQ